MTEMTPHKPFGISDLDNARLEQHPPWFGLWLRRCEEQTYTLRFQQDTTTREIGLSAESAHRRLLAELCERTVPWICYAVGDNCARTYLAQSDCRIRRISELYSQQPASGWPA
jgi:hypothetical protein